MTLQPLNYCKDSQQLPFAKMLGPLKQHCSHSYIILSTILLVKSRSAETSIYFAQKHQWSYASVLVTYLPVDMLVTSIQSYTPDKHQLAQVSLCNISQMLSIYSTGLKAGWPSFSLKCKLRSTNRKLKRLVRLQSFCTARFYFNRHPLKIYPSRVVFKYIHGTQTHWYK